MTVRWRPTGAVGGGIRGGDQGREGDQEGSSRVMDVSELLARTSKPPTALLPWQGIGTVLQTYDLKYTVIETCELWEWH